MAFYKELRCGNLIEVYAFDRWSEYTCNINSLGIVKDNPGQYRPIPLTPEWLERLGFEKWDNNGWYSTFYLALEFEDDIDSKISHEVRVLVNVESHECCILNKTEDISGANTKCKIKHVHTLQNLIFALTGTELTVKGKVEKR